MKNKSGWTVSIRNIHLAMACVMLVVSVLLLISTHNTRIGYMRMRENTDNLIRWEGDANALQMASDYLTEQVRCFAETGKRLYLDNYFAEAQVTRRREKALESMRLYFGDSKARDALEAAMAESVALMDREYYAMRLTVAAYGYDYTEFPEEICAVELSEEDALLPPEKQETVARRMVFDDVYHMRKTTISDNVNACLNALESEIVQQQSMTADALDSLILQERSLIICAIVGVLMTMILTLLLVVSPLLRAVVYIRADQPIPVRGSDEFRFLARTYNLMYEANREQKEQLAFDATHDKLTGIYNRSGYDFFVKNTDWRTSTMLLFDVDKFKQINDTLGHDTGDRVLKRVAETIRLGFRSQDYVCRLGGDEFAVIMVHTEPAHGDLIRGKVAQINGTLIRAEGGLPTVHVSCGVAYGGAVSPQEIYKRADAALYRVKNRGGAGCEIWEQTG